METATRREEALRYQSWPQYEARHRRQPRRGILRRLLETLEGRERVVSAGACELKKKENGGRDWLFGPNGPRLVTITHLDSLAMLEIKEREERARRSKDPADRELRREMRRSLFSRLAGRVAVAGAAVLLCHAAVEAMPHTEAANLLGPLIVAAAPSSNSSHVSQTASPVGNLRDTLSRIEHDVVIEEPAVINAASGVSLLLVGSVMLSAEARRRRRQRDDVAQYLYSVGVDKCSVRMQPWPPRRPQRAPIEELLDSWPSDHPTDEREAMYTPALVIADPAPAL